jgi:methionyl-tRNA synthetase
MSRHFSETWPKLECHYDYFVRTTDPDHEKGVGELWEKVKARGDLYLGSYEGWYCVGCEAYYTEKELEPGGICPLHKTPAERIREPSYFFKLAAYQDRLLEFYEKHPSFVQPTSRMNEVKSFVRGGLEDLSVSRTTFSWGVPVPGDPEHVMYVWFDALFSYYTPMAATPERRAFWPASLHLVGKDILRFHAVYWPAFLMSCGMSDDQIPSQIFAHGFLTFNGQKMSKSLRNTVKPLALAEAFGIDTLRYYLMRAIAFGQDGDFNVKDLVSRYNADLGNALGNLLNRVLKQVEKLAEGRFPEQGELEELEKGLLAELSTAASTAAEAFDNVQPHRALEAIWQVVGATNQYIDRSAPWAASKRGDARRAGTILATALAVLEAVSTMIWPVMPGIADKLRAQLGRPAIAPAAGSDRWPFELAARKAGEAIGVAAPLFPRIDPDQEKVLVAGLGLEPLPETKKNAVPVTAVPTEGGLPYDDFAKVDLRVGVVVSAERVAGKDKLLSLRVDIGEPEPRPIVAGLALSFRPEDLVGQRVIVVANLEPRKFGKDLVSHGMLLAAGPSEGLRLLTVEAETPAGTKVK